MVSSCLKHKLRDDEVLIHLHIPKTAGSSLNRLLENKFPEEDSLRIYRHPSPESIAPIVQSYRMIRGHVSYSIAEKILNQNVFITMLRHPIDRIISFYYFVRARPENPFHQFANQTPLEAFIDTNDSIIAWQMHNQMVSTLSGNDDRDNLPSQDELALAKERLMNMPFFGLTEYFEESAQLLHYTFIWNNEFEAAHVNATARPPREAISKTTLDRIQDYNQLDLELYNFAVALFRKRYQQMVHELMDDTKTLTDRNQTLVLENQQLYDQLHNPKPLIGLYRSVFPLRFRLFVRDMRMKQLEQFNES